jgi:flagellin-like protein
MKFSPSRRRRGISEVMGSLVMIAVTLTAGVAVFGYINGQSGASAAAVGNRAASGVNFLNEREVLVYAAMSGSSPSTSALIWVYNSGSIDPENMTNVMFYDITTPSNVCTIPVSASIGSEQIASITITVPSSPTASCPSPTTITSGTNDGKFYSGHDYMFRVIGLYQSTSQLAVLF